MSLKDEPIAQKGPPPIPILRPTVSQPLIFNENYPLTRENSPPILRIVRSNVLSIYVCTLAASIWGVTRENMIPEVDDIIGSPNFLLQKAKDAEQILTF